MLNPMVTAAALADTAVGSPGDVVQQAPHENDAIAREDTEAEKHNLLPSAAPAVKRSRRDTPFPAPLPYEGSGGAVASSTHHSSEPTALADAMRKVRPGVIIETEIDDLKGGTEWIQGVVQSCKNENLTFMVKFTVTNEQESSEWTEEYRSLPPLACMYAHPTPTQSVHISGSNNAPGTEQTNVRVAAALPMHMCSVLQL